ncbi:MAG: cobalt ECF transporter T component CbiQ [Acidimicrobiia bacterium]
MGVGHAHALYVHGHSPVHALAPQVKLAAIVVFVIAVAITPRQEVWAFGLYAVVALMTVALARVPALFVLSRLAAIVPFILFAVFIPFVGTGERIDFLGVLLSREGLWAAWNIIAKATLGATASIVLIATTEVTDMLRGMLALRVPAVMTSIAGFMVRYLELIISELGRMRMAMSSRGYDPRWLSQARPIATGAGALFVRSYERGERIHSAMLSRGFTGVMPTLVETRATPASWVLALAFPVVCLGMAILALVVS